MTEAILNTGKTEFFIAKKLLQLLIHTTTTKNGTRKESLYRREETMENLLTAKQFEELTKKLESNELFQKSKSIHKVLPTSFSARSLIC